MITSVASSIREGDIEWRITAAQAFLLRLTKLELEGDNTAVRAAMKAIDELRDKRIIDFAETVRIVRPIVSSGSVNRALELLRMAKLHDRYSKDHACILLEPWIVEAALTRLGQGGDKVYQ